jgi:hypothetical protein
MFMSKILFVIAAISFSILSGLFYLSARNNDGSLVVANIDAIHNISQPAAIWQKTTITIEEAEQKIAININAPKIAISGDDDLDSKANDAIAQYVESLKDDFIFAVSTAAYDNGEVNTLNIDTEMLLLSPRLISLAFTETHHLAGATDDDPKRTFLVFDLINGTLMREGNELFLDDLAWSRAVQAIRTSLLSGYQGEPNCDLLFAPASYGLAVSCIGVDWSRGGEHVSVTGDVPMSIVQEYLASPVLSDMI